jgi:phytoene dehydrogenase-like protein
MRVAVAGAGVGGLACAIRLARAGYSVTVYEQAQAPGGKCSRVVRDGLAWDAGPSLLTMPWVFERLFAETGAPLETEVELMRVEPVTRYRFADGSGFDLSADLARSRAALDDWSPGAGGDWERFMATCARMWRAAEPVLSGPPPFPPRPGARADPRDFLRVKPWWTLRQLARAHTPDPRLQMVIERFATYAGADPRRAPAVLALAGYVEHAFGAWHVRGGLYELVLAMVRRLQSLGGELRLGERVEVSPHLADVVVSNADAGGRGERSLSGLAVMVDEKGRHPSASHHEIRFPADYDAEFDDVFVHRRPVRDPTLYISAPAASEGGPDARFVLVNAPAIGAGADWEAEARQVMERLGAQGEPVMRSPADLERETGAPGGAIYGRAPHGRLGTLRRPGLRRRDGVWRVGGSVHPGGGLPLVALGGATVAREIQRVHPVPGAR